MKKTPAIVTFGTIAVFHLQLSKWSNLEEAKLYNPPMASVTVSANSSISTFSADYGSVITVDAMSGARRSVEQVSANPQAPDTVEPKG